MSEAKKFQQRISYSGDLAIPLVEVCKAFGLGEYQSHELVLVGYEDFNVVLQTKKGKFFVKFLGDFRSDLDCDRLITIIEKTIKAGVSEPALYASSQGHIYRFAIDGAALRVIVMECIIGKTFYELQRKPTEAEARSIVSQAAKINSVDHKPTPVYDSWAIRNFLKEFDAIKALLSKHDMALVEPLVKPYATIKTETLPHTLVHEDIIATNVMLSDEGKIYILDFSVADYYPRIQELAVILCNLLFDVEHPDAFERNYHLTLEEYQKKLPLTEQELALLLLFIQVAHAMHIIGALKEEKIKHLAPSKEDVYWLQQGRLGLEYMKNFKIKN